MGISFAGEWFFPDKPKEPFHGTLVATVEGKVELSCFINGASYFDRSRTEISFGIILGTLTNGKPVTLEGISVRSHRGFIHGMNEYVLIIDKCIVGEHIFEPTELNYSKARVHFEYVEDWLDIGLVDHIFTSDLQRVEFIFNRQEPRVFALSDTLKLTMDVEYSVSMADKVNSIDFPLFVFFEIESDDPISLDHMLKYIHRLRMLISNLRNAPIYLDKFQLESRRPPREGDSLGLKDWLDFYFYHTLQDDKKKIDRSKTFPQLKYLLTFEIVEQHFADLARSWFLRYEQFENSINKIYYKHYFEFYFIEDMFSHMCQAMEIFHRTLYKIPVETEESHLKKIKGILAAAPEQHRDWLKEKLAYTNEPTLHERLRELFGKLDEAGLAKPDVDLEKLARKIKDTRNYLTHFNSRLKAKILDVGGQDKAAKFMFFSLVFLLLRELGLSKEILQKTSDRHMGNLMLSIFYDEW